jgi:hypothetical protein
VVTRYNTAKTHKVIETKVDHLNSDKLQKTVATKFYNMAE